MTVEYVGNQESLNATGTNASAAGLRASNEEMMQLRSLFVSAMSQSLSGGVSSGDALLEAVDSIQETSDQRREDQRQEDQRRDALSEGSWATTKKESEQTEIRSAQLKTEYADNFDRQAETQQEYLQKKQRTQDLVSNSQDREALLAEMSSKAGSVGPENVLNAASHSIIASSVSIAASREKNPLASVEASVLRPSSTSQTTLTVSSGTNEIVSSAAFPQGVDLSLMSIPKNTQHTAAAASVFTIFSQSGRIASEKDKVEAENSSVDKKKGKGKISSSFGAAVFEAFRAAEVENSIGNFDGRNRISDPEKRNGENEENVMAYSETTPQTGNSLQPDSLSNGVSLHELCGPAKENGANNPGPEIGLKPKQGFEGQKFEEQLSSALSDSANGLKYSPNFSETVFRQTESASQNEHETADRIRYIRRIAAACQSAAHRSGQVRIKIDLAELGILTLRAQSHERGLSVSFEATTEAAVRFLRKDLSTLKNLLTEKNIVLDEIEIRLA